VDAARIETNSYSGLRVFALNDEHEAVEAARQRK
jgi:hypothetical protein